MTVHTKSNSHEGPISDDEELRQWVERNVASRSLGIMVGGAFHGIGRAEATASDELESWGYASCGSGKHLEDICQIMGFRLLLYNGYLEDLGNELFGCELTLKSFHFEESFSTLVR